MPQRTVGVVGLGYVGLPLALELRAAGHAVVGIERSSARARLIAEQRGDALDLSERHERALRARGILVRQDLDALRAVDLVIVCVGTPLDASREHADLGALEAAVAGVCGATPESTPIVLESTVPIGTTDRLAREHRRRMFFSPERVDPRGNDDIRKIPKLLGPSYFALPNGQRVLSTDAAQIEAVRAVYAAFVEQVILVPEARIAEASKLYENAFRAVNIALANELAELCAKEALDVRAVLDAAGTKPFGFTRFEPGPGVGGHCIPVDPLFFELTEGSLIRQAMAANAERPGRVLRCLYGVSREWPVLIYGVAYKPGVLDTRETPAETYVNRLRGHALCWFDERVRSWAEGAPAKRVEPDAWPRGRATLVLHPPPVERRAALLEGSTIVVDTVGAFRQADHGPRIVHP